MLINSLNTRPRIWNFLHYFKLVQASSQTIDQELAVISRYAAGAPLALEIGAYQGVSTVHIARAISGEGRLWCVDPWPEEMHCRNPCYSIFRRHIERSGVSKKIVVIRKKSEDAKDDLPNCFDFAFIDGDHSWVGVDADWKLVSPRIRQGGFICLHDSVVPLNEPWRSSLDSNRYFEEIIRPDNRFG